VGGGFQSPKYFSTWPYFYIWFSVCSHKFSQIKLLSEFFFPLIFFPCVLVLRYVTYVLCLPCCQATSCYYRRICTLHSLFIMIEFMVVSIPGFVCDSLSIKVAVALCLALCSWLNSELVTNCQSVKRYYMQLKHDFSSMQLKFSFKVNPF